MDELHVLHYYASLRFDEQPNVLLLDDLWADMNTNEKKSYYTTLVSTLLQEDETFFFNHLKSDVLNYNQLDVQLTTLSRMQQLITVIDDKQFLFESSEKTDIAKCITWFHTKIKACCYYLQQLLSLQSVLPEKHLIVTDKLVRLMNFFNYPIPVNLFIVWYDRNEKQYPDSIFTNNTCLLNWQPLASTTIVNWLLARSWQTHSDKVNEKLTYHLTTLRQWATYAFRSAYWHFQKDPAEGVKAYLAVYQKVQSYTENLSAVAWSSRVQAEKKNLSHKNLYCNLLKDLDTPLMAWQLALTQVLLDCFNDIESLCDDNRIERLHECFKVLHKDEVAGYFNSINWVHHSCYDFNDSEMCLAYEMDQFNEGKFVNYHPEITYTITDKLVDSLSNAPRSITQRYTILVHPDKYPDVLKPIANYCSQQLIALKTKIVQLNTFWGRSQWSMNYQATNDEPNEFAYELIAPPSIPLNLTVLTLKSNYIIELQTPDSDYLYKEITKKIKCWDLLCSYIRQEGMEKEVNRYLWLRVQVMNKFTLNQQKKSVQIEKDMEVIKREWDKEKQEKEEFQQENEVLSEKVRQQDAKFAKRLAQDKNKLRAEFNQIFTSQSRYQGFFSSIINDEDYKAIVAAKKKDPNYEGCFDDERVFDDIASEVYHNLQPH
jgi:hypothetical protein